MAEVASEVAAEQGDAAFGFALLASVLMFLALLYLVHWPDQDIRRYTWGILSMTISIFCAVLTYSLSNLVVKRVVLEPVLHSGGLPAVLIYKLAFSCCWHLAFIGALRAVLVVARRSQDGCTGRDAFRRTRNLMEATLLLADTTAFASISFWAELQHILLLQLHGVSRAFGLGVLFGAMLASLLLMASIDALGAILGYFCIHPAGGKQDRFERLRQEVAHDGENDAVGLVGAFLLAQSTRYAIGGVLPNAEGEEPWWEEHQHSAHDVLLLYLAAVAFNVIGWLYHIIGRPFRKAPEPSPHDAPLLQKSVSNLSAGQMEEADEREEEEMDEGMVAAQHDLCGAASLFCSRVKSIFEVFLDQSSSWAFYYATRWLVAGYIASPSCPWSPNVDGPYPHEAGHDMAQDLKTFRALLLAVLVSMFSFCLIWGLDKIADAYESAAKVIRKRIGFMAFLIGFSWEKCFDLAVEAVGEQSPNPILTQSLLGFSCVLVIIPVWVWYILPMRLEYGYRFGFVPRLVVDRVRGMMEQGNWGARRRREFKESIGALLAVLEEEEAADLVELSRRH